MNVDVELYGGRLRTFMSSCTEANSEYGGPEKRYIICSRVARSMCAILTEVSKYRMFYILFETTSAH